MDNQHVPVGRAMHKGPAQLGQDLLVDKILNGKYHGAFVDIGCSFPEQFSNTWYLEKERGWQGIGIDVDPAYAQPWADYRPQSCFILTDATTLDYERLFRDVQFPICIDFLSIDIEPPEASWVVLQRVLETSFTFNVIAFEVDYGGDCINPERFSTRDVSRELLRSKGYILLKEVYTYAFGWPLDSPHEPPQPVGYWYHVDDIWVNQATYDATGDVEC